MLFAATGGASNRNWVGNYPLVDMVKEALIQSLAFIILQPPTTALQAVKVLRGLQGATPPPEIFLASSLAPHVINF